MRSLLLRMLRIFACAAVGSVPQSRQVILDRSAPRINGCFPTHHIAKCALRRNEEGRMYKPILVPDAPHREMRTTGEEGEVGRKGGRGEGRGEEEEVISMFLHVQIPHYTHSRVEPRQ
jgi:hypothetical protein